jgi:hypothetical protein
MSPSINIASVLFVDIPGAKGLFVVDHASGSVRRVESVDADPVEAGKVMMAIRGQMRDSVQSVPYEQIAEVIRTEREVSAEASSKVKERGVDARG